MDSLQMTMEHSFKESCPPPTLLEFCQVPSEKGQKPGFN
jgi:hypothetical protein